MSDLFKSKKRTLLVLTLVVLVITGVSGFIALSLGEGGMLTGLLDKPLAAGEVEDADPDNADSPVEGEEEPVIYSMPGDMRGVFLVPGRDFMADSTQRTRVEAEITQALDDAAQLTMNTVIIGAGYDQGADWDVLGLLVEQARSRGLHTLAVFDLSAYVQGESGTDLDRLEADLSTFAGQYRLDGLLLDGYQNPSAEEGYRVYLLSGGGIGYQNYLEQAPAALVKTASDIVRNRSAGTQVGLLADAVWANADDQEEGSNTTAAFASYTSASTDTRGFVQEELVDFVAVKAFASLTDDDEPFGEVVSWWSEVARGSGVPLYVVHASDKICSEEEGWQSHDQITRQVIEAGGLSAYRGSIFNDLGRLVENPKEATDTLIKYYNDEVQAEHILSELEITKPEQTTFTTFEPNVTFTGASDPNSLVTINEEVIPTDASGYFTLTIDLEAGLNTFVIEHKEKVLTYQITRQVQVLQSMSPQEAIVTDGGMTVTISATAYSDATVTATVAGTTITMEIDDSVEDEADRDSNYKLFVGEYTVPAATDSEQNLGNIVVSATWEGHSDTITGGSIKVNKRAQLEDGVPVVITADQARTYPANTLNNIPHPEYYPLPKGAMDYAVGEEIVYKSGKTTYTYYVLASGLRVATEDLSTSSSYASGNAITAMSVSADRDNTYVTLKMTQQVAYTFRYTSTGVEVEFHYTNTVPGDLSLNANPIFSKASWKGSTLRLDFLKENGSFMGYKGYYDDSGNLVLRFNNPPSSLSSARICIDPGHGGNDSGALGFLAEYPEKVINRQIAEQLKLELEERGATVMLMDTSNNPSKPARIQHAENWNADLFVSIHNNTASRSSAVGTETYYFYPFSRPLATYAANNVSSQFGTTNRGARSSYYNITLSSQFPSVLVECGFLTNKAEYEKLLKTGNQRRIAAGIADSLSQAIKQANTGSSATGEQSVGGSVSAGNDSATGEEEEPQTTPDALTLNRSTLSLEEGESYTLLAETDGEDVTWKSGNTAVATVDEYGVVTAHKEGSAKITATTGEGESAVCQVEVLPAEDNPGGGDDLIFN